MHIFGENLPWLPARVPLLGEPLPDPDLPLGAVTADGETLRATVGEQVIALVHGAWRLQWAGNAPLAASERDTWLTDERGQWPIAPGERIFALLGFGPSVLVADVALGTITRVAADGTRWLLHRSDDRILDATAHLLGQRFAFRTASGAVELRSCGTGELLHRVAPQ